MFKEDAEWALLILKLSSSSFLFSSYSELEGLTASFPKLLGESVVVSYIYQRLFVLSDY
jgi:hypothetical protein